MLKKRFIFSIIILMLISLSIVKIIDNYYSKATNDYIYNETKIIVYNTLNTVISECIEPYLKEDLILVSKNNDKVSNVVINSNLNNQILKSVHNKLNDNFQNNLQSSFKSLKIPIGTLISKTIFAGKGFNVEIPIKPIGSYSVDLKTKSKTQGINTSILEVVLIITFTVETLIPLNASTNVVSNEFLLSSILIQGEVPNYYYASTNNESFPYVPE